MNRPSSVGHLYRFVTRSDPSVADSRRSLSESVHKAALMRESALKSAIFVGVPRVRLISALFDHTETHFKFETILSFAALSDALEDDVKSGLRKDSLR